MTPWELLQLDNCIDLIYEGCEEDLKIEMDVYMDVLRQQGNTCGAPYTEALGGGLLELKPKAGTVRARLMFIYWGIRKILFIYAFKKSGRGKDQKEYRKSRKIKQGVESGKEVGHVITYVH